MMATVAGPRAERQLRQPYSGLDQRPYPVDYSVAMGLELAFETYGLRIEIHSNRPEILDQLIDRFPPGWRAIRSERIDRSYSVYWHNGKGRDCCRLYRDATQVYSSVSLENVLEVLEAEIRLYLAEMAHDRIFVHAGVVGWKGSAILIPGRSFSGKTTLVAQLVRDGATYYSDEYAVLAQSGLVYPYSKHLSIRRDGEQRQSNCPVQMLGGVSGSDPIPIGMVVITRFCRGSRWIPRCISKGQGVLDLLANSVSARRQPDTVLKTLKLAVEKAILLRGVRGEAGDVSHLLLAELERRKAIVGLN